MHRTRLPCPVPDCGGRIDGVRVQDGTIVEWCTTCERRVVALATAGTGVTDAELVRLVETRLVPLYPLAASLGVGSNLLLDAVRRGELPFVRAARMILVARAAAEAWAVAKKARPLLADRVRSVLPRAESQAVSLIELAMRAGVSVPALRGWLNLQRQNPKLRRGVVTGRRKPIRGYWWDEAGA